jgi:cobalt-zinc-cadmium efflux system outer membrane protein
VSAAIEERVGYGLAIGAQADSSAQNVPPGVIFSDGLTEEEAVALALWNNAALRDTLAGLGIAQADLREAGLFVNPSFQVLFPIATKPYEFLLFVPIHALWERPQRMAAARLTLEGVSQQLVQNGLNLIRDVRLTYADYVAATDQAQSADNIASLAEEIAELNLSRLDVGDISELDLTVIRLDALAARDSAEQLEQEVAVAWERLRLLTGMPSSIGVIQPERSQIAPDPEVPMTILLETALRSRPDLRAAELSAEAAGKRVGWERTRIFGTVAGLFNSKEFIGSGAKAGPGLAAEFPIFNRGQGRISRAEAEMEQLLLRYAALQIQVEWEVRTAVTRLQQAMAALSRVREELLPAAEQAVRLAEQAYDDGNISYLDVQTTRRPFLDLRLREGPAVAAVRRARAELDRAVGRNL